MARQKGFSDEDLRLWAAYGRTLHRLMPGRTRLVAPPEVPVAPAAEAVEMVEASVLQKPVLAKVPAEVGLNAAPAGLDKATWKRFSGGGTKVEARLDLHGHTAAKAHHQVRCFLEQAYGSGLRNVEIITGKGEILARELPFWLNAPGLRPLILALAHPHAANTGSVRILLRRRRA